MMGLNKRRKEIEVKGNICPNCGYTYLTGHTEFDYVSAWCPKCFSSLKDYLPLFSAGMTKWKCPFCNYSNYTYDLRGDQKKRIAPKEALKLAGWDVSFI